MKTSARVCAISIAAVAVALPAWAGVAGYGQVGVGAADLARNCLVGKGKSPEDVIGYCTKVMSSTAWHGAAWPYRARAAAYAQLNQPDSALADLDMAVKLSPENDRSLPDTYAERCFLRAELAKDLQGALDDCDKSLGLRADNASARGSRALVEFRQGNFAAAVTDCNTVLAADSSKYSCLYVRGLAKAKLGDANGGNADISAAKTGDTSIASTYGAFGVGP